MRLRTDIWVSAYLRRIHAEGDFAALRKRGAAEAGAVFVIVDRLDGRCALYAPGPSDPEFAERRWVRAHAAETMDAADIEARLSREARVDPDFWVVEVESRSGDSRLDLAAVGDRR